MKKFTYALLVALLIGTAGTGIYLYSSGYFGDKSGETIKESANKKVARKMIT